MKGIAVYPALVMPALVTRDLVNRRRTACFHLWSPITRVYCIQKLSPNVSTRRHVIHNKIIRPLVKKPEYFTLNCPFAIVLRKITEKTVITGIC